jgi:hypothetical protein
MAWGPRYDVLKKERILTLLNSYELIKRNPFKSRLVWVPGHEEAEQLSVGFRYS